MPATRVECRLKVLGRSGRLVVDDSGGDGEYLMEQAREELLRVEKKFGFAEPSSIISDINQCAGTGTITPVDAESHSLFNYVAALWQESSHLFDPTTCLLKNCYSHGGRLLASSDQLRSISKLVDWSALQIDDAGALLPSKGMLIDLDSCIRPYAVDSARKMLVNSGVASAMIDLDQDIATIGRQLDGANWMVGVKHPMGTRMAINRIKLNDSGYAIRGDFENRLLINEEYFSRALSPVDGQPIPGLLSVAVVADTCLAAFGATSMARLKTERMGIRWLEKLGLPWMAIDRRLNCHGPLSPN